MIFKKWKNFNNHIQNRVYLVINYDHDFSLVKFGVCVYVGRCVCVCAYLRNIGAVYSAFCFQNSIFFFFTSHTYTQFSSMKKRKRKTQGRLIRLVYPECICVCLSMLIWWLDLNCCCCCFSRLYSQGGFIICIKCLYKWWNWKGQQQYICFRKFCVFFLIYEIYLNFSVYLVPNFETKQFYTDT